MDTTTTRDIDPGLLIDIRDYVEDMEEEATDKAMRALDDDYLIIPSISNAEGWV